MSDRVSGGRGRAPLDALDCTAKYERESGKLPDEQGGF
jgi:hypothetical protein